MTDKIRFSKMHGLGNDYVYVDCFRQSLNGIDPAALSIAVSDRHRGIGSDGLILITPPSTGVQADVRMEMYNADGSRAEMCGNGIRCVAKYAIEHGLVGAAAQPSTRPTHRNGSTMPPMRQASPSELPLISELNLAVGGFLGDSLATNDIGAVDVRVQTGRGVLDLIAFTANGIVKSVRVDMGEPILEPARIPVTAGADRCVRQPIAIAGESLRMTCVSMGNPHAVFFIENVADADLGRLGPLIERHPSFPNRINAHFAQCRSRDEVRLRTWERGSGITQACGTGACATLVAGVLEERLARKALVHLPGGDLIIEWADSGHVFMTGPAIEVFSGEWPMAKLSESRKVEKSK